MQVDSFTPALAASGFPIDVAPLPAGSIQRVYHDPLPWLILFSLGAHVAFAAPDDHALEFRAT